MRRSRTKQECWLAAAVLSLCAMQTTAEVTWEQVAAQAPATAGTKIAYGSESPHQFGVLRVPEGQGPHPVVLVIHGGCWLAQFDYRHVETLAERLTERGLATWVIEYRRIGHVGGGWPGTFLDVARGADHVRELAMRYPLDAQRIVAVGHSAGAQLALWLAARPRLPPGSEVSVGEPLQLAGVVSLAGITDLRNYALGSGPCNAAVADLMGGLARDRGERYRQVNPSELLPFDSPIAFVHGANDAIVPVAQSRRFAKAQTEAGMPVSVDLIGGAGHFDVVAPFAPAWATVERRILEVAMLQEPAD